MNPSATGGYSDLGGLPRRTQAAIISLEAKPRITGLEAELQKMKENQKDVGFTFKW